MLCLCDSLALVCAGYVSMERTGLNILNNDAQLLSSTCLLRTQQLRYKHTWTHETYDWSVVYIAITGCFIWEERARWRLCNKLFIVKSFDSTAKSSFISAFTPSGHRASLLFTDFLQKTCNLCPTLGHDQNPIICTHANYWVRVNMMSSGSFSRGWHS